MKIAYPVLLQPSLMETVRPESRRCLRRIFSLARHSRNNGLPVLPGTRRSLSASCNHSSGMSPETAARLVRTAAASSRRKDCGRMLLRTEVRRRSRRRESAHVLERTRLLVLSAGTPGCTGLNSLVERLGVWNLPLCPPPSGNAEPLQTQPRAKSH